MKNKILLSILSSFCLSLLFSTVCNAKINSYLIKDNYSNITYEYDVEELTESFLNDKVLYNKFKNDVEKHGMYAYRNDSDKIVAQDVVIDAFLENKNNFNLDNFITSTKTPSIKIEKTEKISADTDSSSNVITDIDISKLKEIIKNGEDLEKYLNESDKFNHLQTPIANWTFKIKVHENKHIGETMNFSSYDYYIDVEWTNPESPYDLLPKSTLYNDKDKQETITLLTNYQKQIYNLLISLYPDKKFSSGFITRDEKQLERTKTPVGGLSVLTFLTWVNHSHPNLAYTVSKQTDFYWYSKNDGCVFIKK